MIIPFNMEDGLLICEGKSNPEWNHSAPHGAGRVGSRGDAKRKMKKESSAQIVQERMKKKGIYTSLVPLDETKEAYKDPKIIEDAIEPTAYVIDRVKPILNMKARK
jgi:RNA-splicing ligase RtcB